MFKTGPAFAVNNSNQLSSKHDSPTTLRRIMKKNENLTLLEAQRQRNLAISRRKIEMGIGEVTRAINK